MSSATVTPIAANASFKSVSSASAALAWDSVKNASEIDELLAFTRPFADFQYLRGCVWSRYAGRLKVLSQYLPVAAAVLEAFTAASETCKHRIIGDPVVRGVIDRGVSHFRFGNSAAHVEQFEEILRLALKMLKANDESSLLNLNAQELRTGPENPSACIWNSEREDDIQTQIFLSFYRMMEGKRSVLVTPTAEELETLRKSLELLRLVLPQTIRSAMDHVHLVAICDAAPEEQKKVLPFTSFTALSIPSTIFLNRPLLSDCWKTAEAILHEALHEKLYDFQHTHSLLRSGYTIETSPTICAEWNRPVAAGSNRWPVCRSTFAFHVYTYLSEFFLRIATRFSELERRFGPGKDFNPEISARRALDRAHHLGFQLRTREQELGAAGRALVYWLTEYLQATDSKPPLPGSYVHLLLDLYERESKQIIDFNPNSVSKGREEQLRRMLRTESLLAGQITSALEIATDAPPSLESARGNLAETIETTRKWVHRSLCKVPAEKASLSVPIGPETRVIGEAIRDLVLNSGGEIA